MLRLGDVIQVCQSHTVSIGCLRLIAAFALPVYNFNQILVGTLAYGTVLGWIRRSNQPLWVAMDGKKARLLQFLLLKLCFTYDWSHVCFVFLRISGVGYFRSSLGSVTLVQRALASLVLCWDNGTWTPKHTSKLAYWGPHCCVAGAFLVRLLVLYIVQILVAKSEVAIYWNHNDVEYIYQE